MDILAVAAGAAGGAIALTAEEGGEAGLTAEKIDTHADVTLDKVGEGFEITTSHLTVTAKIPGADKAKFEEIANKAKAGCPVSKLMKATITMDATLES